MRIISALVLGLFLVGLNACEGKKDDKAAAEKKEGDKAEGDKAEGDKEAEEKK